MPAPTPLTCTTDTPEATRRLAAILAPATPGGTVLALTGDLGTGKTQFAKGFVAGLGGIPETVLSPTFVIVHEYATPTRPVWHLDAYRLTGDPTEAATLGLDTFLNDPAVVTLIEWPERLGRDLPAATWHIRLAHGGGDRRTLIFENLPSELRTRLVEEARA